MEPLRVAASASYRQARRAITASSSHARSARRGRRPARRARARGGRRPGTNARRGSHPGSKAGEGDVQAREIGDGVVQARARSATSRRARSARVTSTLTVMALRARVDGESNFLLVSRISVIFSHESSVVGLRERSVFFLCDLQRCGRVLRDEYSVRHCKMLCAHGICLG